MLVPCLLLDWRELLCLQANCNLTVVDLLVLHTSCSMKCHQPCQLCHMQYMLNNSNCQICSLWLQIASAVFIKPPLATCGLTEQQAQARLTGDIDIFVSKFKPMKNTLSGRDEKTLMKIIVKVDTDEVRALLSVCPHRSRLNTLSYGVFMLKGLSLPDCRLLSVSQSQVLHYRPHFSAEPIPGGCCCQAFTMFHIPALCVMLYLNLHMNAGDWVPYGG